MAADLAAADRGDTGSNVGVAHVGINTPEGKWERDQCKKNLGDLLVVANEIKHALITLNATKANDSSPLSIKK